MKRETKQKTSNRTIFIGDKEIPFPKLVSGKATAIKDIIAGMFVEYKKFKSKTENLDAISPKIEDQQRLIDLQEELAQAQSLTDQGKIETLEARITDLRLKMATEQLEKATNLEMQHMDVMRDFITKKIDENVFDVIAIVLGDFDEEGNVVKYPLSEIKSKMTLDQVATVIGYVVEDILEIKNQFTETLKKLTNLMASK